MAEEQQSHEDSVKKIHGFVVNEMKIGSDKETITNKLVDSGVEKENAGKLVDSIYQDVVTLVKKEQFSSDAFMPSLITGLVAAIIGGAVWGSIIIFTDYELGIIAWGIGAICGYAVIIGSKGRKGTPLQIIAAVTSVIGIILGKYISFFHYLKMAVEEEQGPEAAADLSILSVNVVMYFLENISYMLGAYDVLWVILAIVTAWKIPKSSGIVIPKDYVQTIG